LVAGSRAQTAIDIGANNSYAGDNSRAANVAETIIDATAADTETIAATTTDDDNEEDGVDTDDEIGDDADNVDTSQTPKIQVAGPYPPFLGIITSNSVACHSQLRGVCAKPRRS
jgi:uncharacterized secreted protein with C-terminal beta-propeller domain